ncbi:GNAT family N-acetyltransferase [Bacillus thuringiensis]
MLIDYLQKEYDRKAIYLSIYPENKLSQKLYESIGFHLTGEIEGE